MNAASTPVSRRRGRALAAALVDWYLEARRDLPWRRTRDPYAIWVSEVMLQQTRVEAVRPRWQRFLARFPSLADLAAAPRSEVLAEWAGLGYYRRAHQLHAAAQSIAKNSGAELPRDAASLRLLPGFGAYTAGAVASIAFDEPVAAVDGNVERVISRLLSLDGDPKRGDAARTVRDSAQILVECASPHLVTQALMELGALLCTPRAPRCGECPWNSGCEARRSGVPESFPRKAPRIATLRVSAYAAVARRGAKLLWRRRPAGGHNADLWELPTTAWHPGEPTEEEARDRLTMLAGELGFEWEMGEALTRVQHSITRHRVTVLAYGGTPSRIEEGDGLRWAEGQEAADWGLTAAARKLLAKLPPLTL